MDKDIIIKVGEGYKDIPLSEVSDALENENNSTSYKFFIVLALTETIKDLSLGCRGFANMVQEKNIKLDQQAEEIKHLKEQQILWNEQENYTITAQQEEIKKLKDELATHAKTIELIEGTIGRHKRILD